jgi:hypothetical protein
LHNTLHFDQIDALGHHFLEGVFVGLSPVMNALGNPKITPELKQKIVDGVLEEAGNRSVQQLAKEENEVLLKLLSLRAKAPHIMALQKLLNIKTIIKTPYIQGQ